jgi:hypothetical protein
LSVPVHENEVFQREQNQDVWMVAEPDWRYFCVLGNSILIVHVATINKHMNKWFCKRLNGPVCWLNRKKTYIAQKKDGICKMVRIINGAV